MWQNHGVTRVCAVYLYAEEHAGTCQLVPAMQRSAGCPWFRTACEVFLEMPRSNGVRLLIGILGAALLAKARISIGRPDINT